MHELAITQSVIDSVRDRTADLQVTSVNLSIGKLSGVVPDAVRFCFELVAVGTTLEGASLSIEEPTGRAYCRSCQEEFTLGDLILLCECGSADVQVLAGKELRVLSVEVA